MAEPSEDIFGTMKVGDAVLGIRISHLAEVSPIQRLSPLLVKSRTLLGGVDLRGQLIPVLDPAVICGLGTSTEAPRFAAVLRHENKLLAIGIDEIAGLAYVKDDAIQMLEGLTAPSSDVLTGAFLKDGQVVTVVNVGAMFAMSDVPALRAAPPAADARSEAQRRPMLTFEVGGAFFCMPAIEVYGTVPRQPIERNSLTSGHCLGTITFHGRRVPVMCSVGLLGIGARRQHSNPEVVILRYPDEHILGFAVDAIQDIEALNRDRFSPVPTAIARRNPFLSHVRVQDSARQTYCINVEALRENAELAAIAGMSTQAKVEEEPVQDNVTGKKNVVYERRRYLVIEAGVCVAVPLHQVARILEPPEAVIPLTCADRGLTGFFAHDGASVPLVDLAGFLGTERPQNSDPRVLLVGQPGQQIGFIVDRVRSIATSVWRHKASAASTGEDEIVVQLDSDGDGRVRSVVNLLEIATDSLDLMAQADVPLSA